ncbi:MAG: hypothetical protein ABW136_00450 [Steroidobacteraceae bacterium]
MPHVSSKAAAAVALLLALPALSAQQTLNAEQGWSAVGQCASRTGDRARHDCLDDVLRRAGLLTPEAEKRERQRQFGLEDNAAARAPAPAPSPRPAAAASAPPPPAPVAVPTPAPKVEPPEVDRLEAEVASSLVGNDRKLLVTMKDGAIWKQIDSDTLPRLPVAGDVVRIRKGTLGSYLCALPTRHTFRCQRIK